MCQAEWGWLHGVPYWMPARCARLSGVGYMVFPTGSLLDVPGWVGLVTWCSLLDPC